MRMHDSIRLLLTIIVTGTALTACCQAPHPSTLKSEATISIVWSPDLGIGTYKNPVINADYSDPDTIRVGDKFYLVASSFDSVPGLPILESYELANHRTCPRETDSPR